MELLQHRIDKSMRIIEQMLSICSKPYLALSFGKDSLVMLDLVRGLNQNIKCLFLKSEESFLMYNYEEVINNYKERGLNLHIVETNRLSENQGDWNKARKAGNKDFLLDDFFQGFDGVFMGLRIEESKARRITLIKKENNVIGPRIMRYKSGKREGMYRCCPVADWTSFEIMHYLKEKNLPFLDVYEQGNHIRTTARITGDAARQNSLYWIKKNKPENWNKIRKLIPELAAYV